MKYGINLLLWTDTLSDDKFYLLDLVKTIGYDVVELPMFDKDVENAAKWGKKLDEYGFLRSAACAFGPDESMISADPAINRRAIEAGKRILDCSAAAGCSIMVGDCYSALGEFTGEGPTQVEWNRVLDGLRELAEHGEKVGVQIGIEYLNRFEEYFLNTAADGARLVKELDHPTVGMMFDTFHSHIEEKNIPDAIRSLRGVLNHVHISENDRSTPGSGNVRWDQVFDTLHEIGYDGLMVVEAFGSSLPKLAAATKIWRKMYKDETQLATDALRFMKENVEKRWT